MTPVKVIAVGLFAGCLMLLALGLRSSACFAMGAALGVVPAVSYAIGRRAVGSLQCTRECPEFIHEDESAPVRIHIRGLSNLLGTAETSDHLPEWSMYDPAHDRTLDQRPDEVTSTYHIITRKRGVYTLGPLQLCISDPLGFFKFHSEWPLTSRMVVLPRPLRIPNLQIHPMGHSGEQQFEGVGARGSGIDFHGVREYQPGDELRRVHWRSFARHRSLNVIEFEHTKAEDAVIAVDLQHGSEVGSGRFSSLEYAVRIAAGLAEQALNLGSSVRLVCAGVDGAASTSGYGGSHLYTVLEALAQVQADRRESLASVLIDNMDTIVDGSTVLCLGSRISPDLPGAVGLLTSRGIVVQFTLLALADRRLPSETLSAAVQLASAGAEVTVVECSTSAIQGQVRHTYGD